MAMMDKLEMREEFFVSIYRKDGSLVMTKSFGSVEKAIEWAKDIIMNAYPTYKATISIHAYADLCDISIGDAMLWKVSQFEGVEK